MSEAATRNRVAYDDDVVAWAEEQARLLREGNWALIDIENIAEEIEGVAGSQKSELRNRLVILLQHLLKWYYQPERQGRSWTSTIREQRRAIADVLDDSPSLRRTLPDVLARSYARARDKALEETGVYRMPETCPWAIEQVMSPEFLPE